MGSKKNRNRLFIVNNMKKRYQKAPRINRWDQTKSCNANTLKLVEKLFEPEKIPEELKEQILKLNN